MRLCFILQQHCPGLFSFTFKINVRRINATDCVTIALFDGPFGNGLCCDHGEGSFEVLVNDAIVYQSEGQFTWVEQFTLQNGRILTGECSDEYCNVFFLIWFHCQLDTEPVKTKAFFVCILVTWTIFCKKYSKAFC